VRRGRVGTLAWGLATGGRLTRRERLGQLVLAARAQVQARRDGAPVPFACELPDTPPDSRVAREAFELCESLSSPALVGHCLRTWLWGCSFAQRDGVDHDPELLYVACLFHDLGLTPAHWCHDPAAGCFAVEGALAASRLVVAREWPEDRGARLAEAIALHLNVDVGVEMGAEAHLLHAGAGMDVIGRRRRELAAATRTAVLARHPRAGMAEELDGLLLGQASARPRSRIALLTRHGFVDRVWSADAAFARDAGRAGDAQPAA
jgi:hypothetical protein